MILNLFDTELYRMCRKLHAWRERYDYAQSVLVITIAWNEGLKIVAQNGWQVAPRAFLAIDHPIVEV